MDVRVRDDASASISTEARCGHDDAAADFSGTIVPVCWFAPFVRALWPVKAAAALEQYTGAKERTARAYQSGEREPSASVLRDLIRSPEGFRVLRALVEDNPPDWWREVDRALRIKRAIEGVGE